MKSNDSQLRQMFIRATDEVIPPAPWLESKVIASLPRRRPASAFGGLGIFNSGLRLTAGVVALLIAIGTVAALLMSTRLIHNPTQPGGRSAVAQTPLPDAIIPFTPSPPVRASNWPPGGPIPAKLAGAWQRASFDPVLHLGSYTFQLGEEHPDPGNSGAMNPVIFGSVLVNGSEIDFMSEICTAQGDFGFERYLYSFNGDVLVLTRKPGSGQSHCWDNQGLWPSLAGTYVKVAVP